MTDNKSAITPHMADDRHSPPHLDKVGSDLQILIEWIVMNLKKKNLIFIWVTALSYQMAGQLFITSLRVWNVISCLALVFAGIPSHPPLPHHTKLTNVKLWPCHRSFHLELVSPLLSSAINADELPSHHNWIEINFQSFSLNNFTSAILEKLNWLNFLIPKTIW